MYSCVVLQVCNISGTREIHGMMKKICTTASGSQVLIKFNHNGLV